MVHTQPFKPIETVLLFVIFQLCNDSRRLPCLPQSTNSLNKTYPGSPSVDQTACPFGRIGNPWSMDHPKDQPLCLVDWLPPGTSFPPAPQHTNFRSLGDVRNPRPVVRRWCHGRRWQPQHLGRAGRFFCSSISFIYPENKLLFHQTFQVRKIEVLTYLVYVREPPAPKNSRVKQ